MKRLLRQSGFSLLEGTVAMGLLATAAVGYMTYAKNVAQHRARTDLNREISGLSQEATEYLASKEACGENVVRAFGAQSFTVGVPATGVGSYNLLITRMIKNDDGSFSPKILFEKGTFADPGKRLFVKNLSYKIENLGQTPNPTGAYNVMGDLKISVELERCTSGGRHEACAPNNYSSKNIVITKGVAFKLTGPSSGTIVQTTGATPRPRLTCFDSSDGNIDAAIEYTDIKNCITEAKVYLMTGREGTISCGEMGNLVVRHQNRYDEITSNGTFTVPTSYVPNTLIAELMGAGGGGGGGGRGGPPSFNEKSGGKGFRGEFISGYISNPGITTCTTALGIAGVGGDVKSAGAAGTATTFTCGPTVLTAAGGAGGCGYCRESDNGQDGEPNYYGEPGGEKRRGYSGSSPRPASRGAGGGSGGDKDGNKRRGGPGGLGKVIVRWKVASLSDPDGVLGLLDPPLTTAAVMSDIGMINPETDDSTCEPVHGGWSSWSTWSECDPGTFIPDDDGGTMGFPGITQRFRSCSNPAPNSCGNPCSGESFQTASCSRRGDTPPCFVAGTRVTLASGEKKNIEDVLVGDYVRDGSGQPQRVRELLVHDYAGELYSINGGEYFFTPSHPFRSLQGWKALDPINGAKESGIQVTKMKIGDILIKEGELEVIYALDSIPGQEPVYNLKVTGSREYLADDFVVHNKD